MSSTSSAPSAASPDAGTKLPAASAGVSQTRPSSSVPKVEYQDPDSDVTADEAISSVPFQQSLPGSEDDVLQPPASPLALPQLLHSRVRKNALDAALPLSKLGVGPAPEPGYLTSMAPGGC